MKRGTLYYNDRVEHLDKPKNTVYYSYLFYKDYIELFDPKTRTIVGRIKKNKYEPY